MTLVESEGARRDLVAANRILGHEGILDAYGHVSVRHPENPGHFLLSRARSPEYVEVADVLEAMNSDTVSACAELRVDGGASANDLLMQGQANLLGIPVVRPQVIETTALGAAYLAGLAAGFWESPDEIAKLRDPDTRFEPEMSPDEAERLKDRWRNAVERSKNWSTPA